MILAITGGGVLPHPTALQVHATAATAVFWLTLFGAIGTVLWTIFMTAKTKSPLFAMLLVGSALIFPTVVEPAGDIVLATYYPADMPFIAMTILDRPIPWFVVLGYTAGLPIACYVGYKLFVSGARVRNVVLILIAISLAEGIVEMTAVHFGFMSYYGNHSLIFGVPVTTLIQNAGMFVVIGVGLAYALPRVHGLWWLAVPLIPPMTFGAYAITCTLPNFYAIHGQWDQIPFWGAAIVSAALNISVPLLALYTPFALEFRNKTSMNVPERLAVG